MTKPLWIPSQDRIDRANLSRFMRFAREEAGNADLNSYAPLWRLSVEQPARFWTLLWDFVGIRGNGDRSPVLVDDDGMATSRWFPGVQLNFAHNLLRFDDERVAIRTLAPDGERDALTYAQLNRRVAALSSAMRAAGVAPGDRVAALLPNCAEALVAMLAAASVGAAWFTCPANLSRAQAASLLSQLQPRLLLADTVADLEGLDGLLSDGLLSDGAHSGGTTAVLMRGQPGDDASATSLLAFVAGHGDAALEFTPLPFDQPLYLTLASRRDGAREVLVHGAGGTLIQHLKELVLHADLKREDRIFFHADNDAMSWYWLASSLATGAVLVLHETGELSADGDALWDLVDEAGITVLGLHAAWLDAAAAGGRVPRDSHRLQSLKTILTAGPALSAGSYEYVYRDIKERVFLAPVATGTDTLACVAIGAPLMPVVAGEIPCRALGMEVEVLDEQGHPLVDAEGDLAVCAPFPSMPLGFLDDADGRRYAAAYFSRHPGVWCCGERATLTAQDSLIL
jgi:acetoacetyl-CoA synthetase